MGSEMCIRDRSRPGSNRKHARRTGCRNRFACGDIDGDRNPLQHARRAWCRHRFWTVQPAATGDCRHVSCTKGPALLRDARFSLNTQKHGRCRDRPCVPSPRPSTSSHSRSVCCWGVDGTRWNQRQSCPGGDVFGPLHTHRQGRCTCHSSATPRCTTDFPQSRNSPLWRVSSNDRATQ